MINKKKIFIVTGLLFILFFVLNTVAFAGSSVFVNDKTKENGITNKRYQSTYDNYKGKNQNTTVKGSSEDGVVKVKAGDGSAEASFKNNETNRGYVDRAKSKKQQDLTNAWFSNLFSRYKEDIDETIKCLAEDSEAVQGAAAIEFREERTQTKTTNTELFGDSYIDTMIIVNETHRGNTIYKHVKDYYVQWVFKNKDTGEVEIYNKIQTPMDEITWVFKKPGTYIITSTPYSKWDVGHYVYFDVAGYKYDENTKTYKKYVEQRRKWVHEKYVDDWYTNARATYTLTISVDELHKPIEIPPPNTSKEVKPITELVK